MKLNKLTTYILIAIILFSSLTFYAQTKSHRLTCQEVKSTLQATTTAQASIIYIDGNKEQLKAILDKLDKLESKQAEIEGDIGSLKQKQTAWAEQWSKIFEPMQKEYEGRK